MRKSFRFTLSALLVAVLLMSSVAAFAEGGVAKFDPPVTLSTARAVGDSMQRFIDIKSDVLTDNIWFRSYRDELGIDVTIDWSAPGGTQYDEKINTQIAANDLPDVFVVNANQLKMLVEYGAIHDLTDLFKQYASPFTMQMMEDDMYTGIDQATFDGRLMALPVIGGNRDGSMLWWIRYDWLEKLGLEEPKTFDDLIAVMYAFTNDDPDGNGEKDTYGMGLNKELFGGHITVDSLGQGLRAYTSGWVQTENGIEYGSIQPEVKTMLETLAKLYADGVIDKEFIVKDSSKVSEEVIAGKIGMFAGQHWQAFWPLQDAKNANTDADWRAISIVSNDGEKALTMLSGSASNYTVVNIDYPNPEAAISLYNYYYAKDPALSPDFDLRYHGRLDAEPDSEITEYYQWAAVQSWYPMQNLFIHRGVDRFFLDGDETAKDNYWIKDNIEQNENYIAGDNTYWATHGWSGPSDYSGEGRIDYYDKNDMFLQNAYIGANTDGMSMYNATLEQLRLETFTKIITGESTIDAFDAYVQQWKTLGGDQITAEVNAAK